MLVLHVGGLHLVVELLHLHGVVLPCLSGIDGSLLDALVALEERAERVFHAHVPYVEVLVYERKLEEDTTVEVVGCNECHLWEQVALGNHLLLFGDAHGVGALFQEGRAQGACLLPVSLAVLAVNLVYDLSIGHYDSVLRHAQRIAELVFENAVITVFPNDVVEIICEESLFEVEMLSYSPSLLCEASLQLEQTVYSSLREDRCRQNTPIVTRIIDAYVHLVESLFRPSRLHLHFPTSHTACANCSTSS